MKYEQGQQVAIRAKATCANCRGRGQTYDYRRGSTGPCPNCAGSGSIWIVIGTTIVDDPEQFERATRATK